MAKNFSKLRHAFQCKQKTERFPLEQANVALDRFRAGELKDTAVLLLDVNQRLG